MSGFYTVAYAAGFHPWERAGREAAKQFGGLLDRNPIATLEMGRPGQIGPWSA
jgi:hypothetical protein